MPLGLSKESLLITHIHNATRSGQGRGEAGIITKSKLPDMRNVEIEKRFSTECEWVPRKNSSIERCTQITQRRTQDPKISLWTQRTATPIRSSETKPKTRTRKSQTENAQSAILNTSDKFLTPMERTGQKSGKGKIFFIGHFNYLNAL